MSSPLTFATTAGSTAGTGLAGASAGWPVGDVPGEPGAPGRPGGIAAPGSPDAGACAPGCAPAGCPVGAAASAGLAGVPDFWQPALSATIHTGHSSRRNACIMGTPLQSLSTANRNHNIGTYSGGAVWE